MPKLKSVLLFFDPDIHSHTEVSCVEELANHSNIHVTVLCVVKNVPSNLAMAITQITPQEILHLMIKEHQEKADSLVRRLSDNNVKATSLVLVGTPFLEIIRQVLVEKHDLVMLMAEGKESLEERIFGSTSMHLMRKCPCPVWVVKSKEEGQIKQVLAAVDIGSELSGDNDERHNIQILELASLMAQLSDADLQIVQAWSVFGEGYLESRGGLDQGSIEKVREDTKAYYKNCIDRLLPDLHMEGTLIRKHLPRSEDASRSIIELVKKEKIDLLVMGTVCRTGIEGFLIGNTAEKVLNEVNCSVLTVKPEGFITPVKLPEAQ